MALRRGKPSETEDTGAEQFSYTPTAQGAKPWSGWIACEPFVCKAHEVPTQFGTDTRKLTKPCIGWITSGALRCPWCKPFMKVPQVAYVFLWREVDSKPVCVIVHESAFDLLVNLQYGVYAVVGREVGDATSVYVRAALGQKEFRSIRACRKCACDPEPSLLTMWKLPELVEWYGKQTAASDKAVTLPEGTAVNDAGEPLSPMMQAAGKRFGSRVMSDEEAREHLKRLQAGIGAMPSTNGRNGKHPKPR